MQVLCAHEHFQSLIFPFWSNNKQTYETFQVYHIDDDAHPDLQMRWITQISLVFSINTRDDGISQVFVFMSLYR